MKTLLSIALAAATVGGALAATSVPAAAQSHGHGGHSGGFHGGAGYHGGGGYRGGGWDHGGYRYHGRGWAGGWYGGLAWGPGCYSVWRWDPYYGREVPVPVCY